jgi:putative transposase
MAAAGARVRVPVAVACRVLGLSTQGYYKWKGGPVVGARHPLTRQDHQGTARVIPHDCGDLPGYTADVRTATLEVP